MTVKRLEEDLKRMGLSSNEIREALPFIGESAEADAGDEEDQDFFGDDVYLSDLMDEEDDGEDGDEEQDEDDLMLEKLVRLKRGTAKDRRAAKAYYRANRATINRAMTKKRKTTGFKRHQVKLAKMSKGGRKTRRSLESVEQQESILSDLEMLAESMNHEPESRFEEYVEAFNHIADLGEMGAMQLMEEDEEAAKDVLGLSLKAEAILKEMEGMDGALLEEEDAMLEEALADAMEELGILFESNGLMMEADGPEDEEDEDEDEDEEEEEEEIEEEVNPFLEMAQSLREAKRTVKRGAQSKTRKLLNTRSTKTVKGQSAWGKANKSPGASRKQLAGRKDVRDKEALLGYLRAVKSGKVAPGQAMAYSKSGKKLNKGARKAMAMGKKNK